METVSLTFQKNANILKEVEALTVLCGFTVIANLKEKTIIVSPSPNENDFTLTQKEFFEKAARAGIEVKMN